MSEDGDITLVKGHKRGHMGGGGRGRFGEGGRCCTGITGWGQWELWWGGSRVCATHGVLPSCTWEWEAVFIPTSKTEQTEACKKGRVRKKKQKTTIMQNEKKIIIKQPLMQRVKQHIAGRWKRRGNLTPEMAPTSSYSNCETR